MSTDSAYLNSNNYLNINGLANLKGEAKTNPQSAKHEVAQQFESMLVQMLLKSMRDANKAIIDKKETDSSEELYQDLFDKQVALSISEHSLGLGKTIENSIGQVGPQPTSEMKSPDYTRVSSNKIVEEKDSNPKVNESPVASNQLKEEGFTNEWDFVKSLWSHAKKAAFELGVDPKLLIAQAALETGWGKKIIAHTDKESTFNLFNIKANGNWDKKTANVNTLEEKDGIVSKEKGSFRAYSSYAESFNDYVDFIKNNPRYEQALKEAGNPDSYIKLLQQANYATDSNYSNKVMDIYKGDRLNNLFQKVELT